MSAYSVCLIVLSIVAVLAVLFVHELGHLLVARWCGHPVLRLSVGFGPELLGLTDRHGTRWVLAALPFGGCIKMEDNGGDSAAAAESMISNRLLSRRAAIFAAGPVANLVFAWGVCGLSLAIFGEGALLPTLSDQPAVFMASLISGFSITVALFNLMPILPLDGGSLALIGIEAVTRKAIPEDSQRKLRTAGVAIIIAMTIPLFAFLIYSIS